MAIYKNTPPIITSGLSFYVDAANKNSYIGSGTNWNDLSGNNNSGSLINGPLYSTDKGGSISFDGVNDYATTNITIPPFMTTQNSVFSVMGWIYAGTTITGSIWCCGDDTLYQNMGLGIVAGTSNLGVIVNSYASNLLNSGLSVNLNAWNFVGLICQGTATKYCVLNKSELVSAGNSNNFTIENPRHDLGMSRYYGSPHGASYFNGKIAIWSAYNRSLSSQEILQNYNATKRRFGII